MLDPIVLMRIADVRRIDLVKQVLQAHAYWREKGLDVDLVILNEDFSGYRQTLQDRILGLIAAGTEAHRVDKPGGIFLRRSEQMSEEDRVLLQTVARVILTDSAETLAEQVERRSPFERKVPRFMPTRSMLPATAREPAPRERIFYNGLGGFTPDGREYVVSLAPGQTTPAPWANVLANPQIGTVITESGGAYTWVDNAHEFRLTPWRNDPVGDTCGEAFCLRDDETGQFWSPTPLPARGNGAYVCRHGFGYSVFEYEQMGIRSELWTYVALDAPVKLVVVKVRNGSGRPRRLSATGFWELVLGQWRHPNLMHVVTEIDPATGALFARNAYNREFAGKTVFVNVSEAARTLTGNRTEFLGRNGTAASPAAMRQTQLSGQTGAGLDPCAALQASFDLADGEERELVFVLGAANSVDEAHQLIRRFSGPVGARQVLEGVWEFWKRTLGVVYAETPDPALNLLVNGWLEYQTLVGRYWGRSGYYQSGGAYGFRDQLQDTTALLHAAPWTAREHLLRCAGRQFLEGDVQHWWHPPTGRGVRENGGQYTHGAIWAIMAFAELGDTERAWELFSMLNPIRHTTDMADVDRYKVEPYVVAADVYAVAPHAGCGGWSWYTGSAGWMYRLIVETLLGLRLEGDQLRVSPRLPRAWDSLKLHYRYRDTFYHITVKRIGADAAQEVHMTVDGREQTDAAILLVDDRQEHTVELGVR